MDMLVMEEGVMLYDMLLDYVSLCFLMSCYVKLVTFHCR